MPGDSPTYSVCMTTRNDGPTVKRAIDALLANTDREETEVVIVDSESNDGQLEILQDYSKAGLIRLFVRKCNRGEGRQIALKEARGKYIISGVDTDDEVGPGLKELLSRYHRDYEGSVLHGLGITVAPKDVAESIGGWKPLFCGEDFDFWQRAESAGVLRNLAFDPYATRVRRHHGVVHTTRVLWRYAVQRRKPVVSWKWKPMWGAVRLVYAVTTIGRAPAPQSVLAEGPGKT